MRTPNPHLFIEGGGLVTRCQDVRLARRLLVELYLERCVGGVYLDDPDGNEPEDRRQCIAEASRQFPAHRAQVGHGRIIPADPYDPDHTWWWSNGSGEIGQRGVTQAVWWNQWISPSRTVPASR